METIEESEDKQKKIDVGGGVSPPLTAADAGSADGDEKAEPTGQFESSPSEDTSMASPTPEASTLEDQSLPLSEDGDINEPLAMSEPLGLSAANKPESEKVKTKRPISNLPPVLPGADLAQPQTKRHWLRLLSIAICFIATFAIYISYIPNFILFGNPPTGDQPYYLMDVISMAQDWDLNVKNNYDNADYDKFYNYKPPGFIGMTAPYPPGRQLADSSTRPESEQYSAHLAGLPVLLLPGWVIGEWYESGLGWPSTLVVMCLLSALVSLNIFLFAHEITGKLWIAWAVWLPLAFSGPIMTFSYVIFTEVPVGLMLIYAFRRLALGWGANGPLRLILVGACIGYIPWLSLRCAPIAVLLSLYAAVQWWRFARNRESGVGDQESVSPEPELALNEVGVSLRSTSPEPENGDVKESQPPTPESSDGGRVRRFFREVRLYANRRNLAAAAWLVVPVILSAVLLVGFNLFRSGVFLPSSSEKGRVDHFFWPWVGFTELAKFINAGFGTFFDSRFGLLFYTPIYLLAIVGLIAMFRTGRGSDRRLLLWIAIISLPYMFFIIAYEGWHGVWSPPARYLATFVPLAAAPLAVSLFALTRNWITGILYGVIYIVMSLPGLITANAMLLDARVAWPLSYSPTYEWLAQERVTYDFLTGLQRNAGSALQYFSLFFRFDVQPYFANFVKPDEVFHPVNSGRYILGSLLIVFFCSLLLSFAPMMRTGKRWSLLAQVGTWLGVFGLVGLLWFGMNDQYLKHKTTLTLDNTWIVSPHLLEPYGIAYHDGKVYLTSFARDSKGFVSTLDVNTGESQVMQPTMNGQPAEFAHPTDIKIGPDGLLYVLNNGEGEDALIGMTPDGEIKRKLALNGKTPIATALYIGPDGSFYVADMLGGKINKWGKDGGDVITSWGGVKGGYNNPSGVAVSDTSQVFAIESGNALIHEIIQSGEGEYPRTYDPQCRPVHAVASGDWLDISCEMGLVSINTKENYLQFTSFQPPGPKPETFRGLAYGPDNTLYMIDANTDRLLRYRIEH